MRISLTGWRRSTLGIVTAFACASGLQISGCARSSSRDVGADLSRRAADAAFKAERDIAKKASRQPLFGSKDTDNSSLASKPIDRSTISRNGSYENPLAELLASRSDKYPSGDPFIDSEQPIATFKGKITKDVGDQQVRKDNIQLTQHESKGAATDDGSAIAKPIAARSFPKSTESEDQDVGRVALDNDWANKKKPKVHQDRIKKHVTNNGKTPSDPQNFTESDLGFWKSANNDNTSDTRTQNDVQAKSHKIEDENWNHLTAHQQHVKALIKQSEGQHAKGELHAAYRSALLASSLVDQYQLSIAEGELDPSIIAQEISAQIWGSNKQNQTAQKEPVTVEKQDTSKLPIIRPRQSRSAQHDQVFQTPDSFLNWQASEESHGGENLTAEKQTLKATSQLDKSRNSLSNAGIKSALFASSRQTEGHINSRSMNDNSIRQTSNVELMGEGDDQWISTDLDLIAENKQDASELLNSQRVVEPLTAQPMPSPAAVERLTDSVRVENVGSDRGPLFAPIHEINPFEANLETISETRLPEQTEVKEVVAEAPIAEVRPQGRLKWGVLAFILATLSTLVGLKLNKPPEAKSEPKDENSDDESDQHLKLSKAA